MEIICWILQPMVDFAQTLLAFAWTPLSWYGLTVPSIASWFNPLLPCNLT
ncbi:MAG: hypothetical protein JXQ75_10070 [Phycisphaerae bacterium]|nr:hypothetical protein [Phycisphaerae bacterium]